MRATAALLLGGLCLAAGLPAPADGHHLEALPVVYRETRADSPAWAFLVDIGAGGRVEFFVEAHPPRSSSAVSIGVARTDAAGVAQSLFGYGELDSPERLIVRVQGEDLLGVRTEPPGAGDTYLLRLSTSIDGAPPGRYGYVIWVAGATGYIDGHGTGVSLRVAHGQAWAAGDPELEGGAANVQLQPTLAGAKAIAGTGITVPVEGALYGLWLSDNNKDACAVACVELDETAWALTETCDEQLGTGCGTAQLSWSGPGGSGGSGLLLYTFGGEPSGEYAFRVDAKADAYADTGAHVWAVGAYPWEDATVLSVADVAFPAP